MKNFVFSLVLVLCVVFSTFSQNKAQVENETKSSFVVITSDAAPVGYGFFVARDLLVTTINTIGKYKSAQILLNNGKYYNVLGYTSSDPENDLVLLKTDLDSASFVSINSQYPSTGQNVFLVDLNSKNDLGLVEATIKDIKDFGEVKLLSVEAQNQVKVSGLPVFEESGHVIGVSILPLLEDPGLNFAIPAEKIENLLANQHEIKKIFLLMPAFEDIKGRSLANMDKSVALKEFLDSGISRYEQKDYKGAIEKFNIALRISPTDVDALVFRGQSKYMLMQYKDAMEDFNKAIVLQPEFAEAYDLRGLCKAELGDMDGACEDWTLSFEKGYDPAFKLLKYFCDLEE
ncbi:MAG TPA: hypothetical protein PKW80_07510 [Bacteroidales bacterium]|nr:hypothetical protein [Bacteroidales bacterium]